MSHDGFAPGILYKGETIKRWERENTMNQYQEAQKDETKSRQNTK